MDNNRVIELIKEFCEAAFIEVFQNQNCLVYRAEEDRVLPESRHVAIDAVADELQLLLSLCIPEEVLRSSYPNQDTAQNLDLNELQDWYHELANRLMGSLKNRVMVGTSLMRLGLPQQEASGTIPEGFESSVLAFECAGTLFGGTLGIRILSEIESLEQEEVDCMDGELEFF